MNCFPVRGWGRIGEIKGKMAILQIYSAFAAREKSPRGVCLHHSNSWELQTLDLAVFSYVYPDWKTWGSVQLEGWKGPNDDKIEVQTQLLSRFSLQVTKSHSQLITKGCFTPTLHTPYSVLNVLPFFAIFINFFCQAVLRSLTLSSPVEKLTKTFFIG